jgi:hypothetical protein
MEASKRGTTTQMSAPEKTHDAQNQPNSLVAPKFFRRACPLCSYDQMIRFAERACEPVVGLVLNAVAADPNGFIEFRKT